MDLFSVYNWLNSDLKSHLELSNIKTRPNASSGLWVCLLLPACLCATVLRLPTSDTFNLTAVCSLGLCLASILFLVFPINISKGDLRYWNGWLIPAVLIFLLDWSLLERGLLFSMLSGVTISLGFKHTLSFILKTCSLSFTVGEALLVVQAIILFVYNTLVNIHRSWRITPTDDYDIITLILQVGLLTTLLIVISMFRLQDRMDLGIFIITVGGYLTVMVGILHVLLKRSSIVWMISFVFDDSNKTWMIIYWAIASSLGGIAVSGQIFAGTKATTSRRKTFHILSTIVYLTGYIYEYNLIYLASGLALAVLIAFETVRKLKMGMVSTFLNEGYVLFADEKDAGGLSLTPLYLLIGMASPLALRSNSCSSASLLTAVSGILSVGIGDTCASYYGSNFGKTMWTGSCKSVEGTLANMASQFITLFCLSYFGFIESSVWITVICVAAVMTNSTIEAKTDQVDNLTLPLITYLVLLLA